MTSKAEQLLELAKAAEFSLGVPELKLLRCVAAGVAVDFKEEEEEERNATERLGEWGEERRLSAELIAWVCTDRDAREFITHKGLQVIGAKIEGSLDLSFAQMEFPLAFSRCAFMQAIRLDLAAVRFLDLSGSSVSASQIWDDASGQEVTTALEARGLQVESDIWLSNGFSATGRVWLIGASIGGCLQCENGTFNNETGIALGAEGAEIKGTVLLSNGFSAKGMVWLSGATIGGYLQCENGTFNNETGIALGAEGAEIKGTVLLRNGFSAKGMVWLSGATIGGSLECCGGTFNNETGIALGAQSAEIKGDVSLSNGFSAKGKVWLAGASIGLGLELRAIGSGDMKLDLSFATTSTLVDEKDSWPETGKLNLDGFTYEKIFNGSPVKGSDRLDWIRRQNLKASFSPQPYEQAARVLRASGYEQAATEVLIGKQEDLRQYGNLSRIGWFWNWFLGHTIAHGYKPHYALYWATGFIAAGTALFGAGYAQDPRLISPANVAPFEAAPATAPQLSEDYPKFNALVYSLDVFVPIVDFYQKSYWLPNANRGAEIPLVFLKTGALLRWYFWLHIVAGWVLTSLWVAGFTGLVRRLE